MFKTTIHDLYWITGAKDDPEDLCLHGHISVQIGNTVLEDNGTDCSTIHDGDKWLCDKIYWKTNEEYAAEGIALGYKQNYHGYMVFTQRIYLLSFYTFW